MVQKKQVSIKELNATVGHHFPFSVGDEVKIDRDGNVGIVEDAIWEGNDAEASHFIITYHVKTADGVVRELNLNTILVLNRTRD